MEVGDAACTPGYLPMSTDWLPPLRAYVYKLLFVCVTRQVDYERPSDMYHADSWSSGPRRTTGWFSPSLYCASCLYPCSYQTRIPASTSSWPAISAPLMALLRSPAGPHWTQPRDTEGPSGPLGPESSSALLEAAPASVLSVLSFVFAPESLLPLWFLCVLPLGLPSAEGHCCASALQQIVALLWV